MIKKRRIIIKPKAKVHNNKEKPRSLLRKILSNIFGFKNHHKIDAKNENNKGKCKEKLQPWPRFVSDLKLTTS